MKIFNQEAWPNKINFVDNNNVVVGWSDDQSCCEDVGYFFSKQPRARREEKSCEQPNDYELSFYRFDPDFCEEIEDARDSGGIIRFRLINDSGETLYLQLYNYHNGYYSHGFTFKHGNVTIKSGQL